MKPVRFFSIFNLFNERLLTDKWERRLQFIATSGAAIPWDNRIHARCKFATGYYKLVLGSVCSYLNYALNCVIGVNACRSDLIKAELL